MKKIITGLFAIAAFAFSVSAQTTDNNGDKKWNKDGQPGTHRDRGERMENLEKLNLSADQKQQMKTINEDFRTKMQLLNKNENITVKDLRAQRKTLLQERKNKIAAILTPGQRTQFEQFAQRGPGKNRDNFGDRGDMMDRGRGEGMHGDRLNQMKNDLGLTDDQVAKIKANGETFRQREQAIRDNQSLTPDKKREQSMNLRKEREKSLKSFLTADQIAKLQQMKGGGNGNGDRKEKRKVKDGKEKIKIKTS